MNSKLHTCTCTVHVELSNVLKDFFLTKVVSLKTPDFIELCLNCTIIINVGHWSTPANYFPKAFLIKALSDLIYIIPYKNKSLYSMVLVTMQPEQHFGSSSFKGWQWTGNMPVEKIVRTLQLALYMHKEWVIGFNHCTEGHTYWWWGIN